MLKAVVSPPVSTDAAGGLPGALRGGLEGLSGKLFAELLTSIAAEAPPRRESPRPADGQGTDRTEACRKDKAERAGDTDPASPANDDEQETAKALAQEQADEDRARIRDLLRRLRAQGGLDAPAMDGKGVKEGAKGGAEACPGTEVALDAAPGEASPAAVAGEDPGAGLTDEEKALLRFLAEAHAHLEACRKDGEKSADVADTTKEDVAADVGNDAARLEQMALALLQRLVRHDETSGGQGAGFSKGGLPETAGEKPKDFSFLPGRSPTSDEAGGSQPAADEALFADASEDGLTLQATAGGAPTQDKGADDAMPETVRERLAAFLEALRQGNASPESPANAPAGSPNPGLAGNTAFRPSADLPQTPGRGGEDGAGAPPAAAAAAARGAGPSSPASLMAESTTRPVGSYDFASQLSATRAARGGAAGLPPAVEQVALHLHRQAKEGTNEMTLQLRPVELGRIEIKLSFGADNGVQGTVVADSPATLDMLQKDQGSLQRALQEAGLKADSGCLQFSLRGDGQPQTGGQTAFNGGRPGPSFASGRESADGEGADMAEAESWILTPGRVNLRV